MTFPMHDPFESIESAHDFVSLLCESIAEARRELEIDVENASESGASRRLDALRIAAYNLEKLEIHVNSSSRILNDLRTLRRLLFEERNNNPVDARAKAGEALLSSKMGSHFATEDVDSAKTFEAVTAA